MATFAVATASLGMNPIHTLKAKFEALQQAGFARVTVGFENFMEWARQHHPDMPESTGPPEWCEGGEPDPSDEEIWRVLDIAADELKQLAANHALKLMAVQPLNQFDGWPQDHPRAAWAKRKAERWLPLCSRFGVELLQVGSNNMPDASTDVHKYAADMRWLAELGAKQTPPVKIAYECWCFSHHINTWEQTWEIVQLADHPNCGLCLDVAHFPLAPTYGWDVRTGEGFDDAAFDALVERLKKVPAEKIFYVEISDMVTPRPALGSGSLFDDWEAANKPARGDRFAWTVSGRPLPFVGLHPGAETPAEDVPCGARVAEAVKAIVSTGFKGLFVFEFFEIGFMTPTDETIPRRYASACTEAKRILLEKCF